MKYEIIIEFNFKFIHISLHSLISFYIIFMKKIEFDN